MLLHTDEYSSKIDNYLARHFAKPGITGWAQVNGFRGETKELSQMENRIEYDIWYIENWSILLDLKIIFKTIYSMFTGDKNAY
jgi:putative colanic acid biosynthesis UDP-glucose lipid carrier transferase